MNPFLIKRLDHVAIIVNDIEKSIEWYEKVLGLKKYKLKEWGESPIFMLAGKTGIAIFPANSNTDRKDTNYSDVKIDHFAFNVDQNNFNKANEHFKKIGIDFDIKDHIYFRSIYTLDPDGNTVELTTPMVSEEEFYK